MPVANHLGRSPRPDYLQDGLSEPTTPRRSRSNPDLGSHNVRADQANDVLLERYGVRVARIKAEPAYSQILIRLESLLSELPAGYHHSAGVYKGLTDWANRLPDAETKYRSLAKILKSESFAGPLTAEYERQFSTATTDQAKLDILLAQLHAQPPKSYFTDDMRDRSLFYRPMLERATDIADVDLHDKAFIAILAHMRDAKVQGSVRNAHTSLQHLFSWLNKFVPSERDRARLRTAAFPRQSSELHAIYRQAEIPRETLAEKAARYTYLAQVLPSNASESVKAHGELLDGAVRSLQSISPFEVENSQKFADVVKTLARHLPQEQQAAQEARNSFTVQLPRLKKRIGSTAAHEIASVLDSEDKSLLNEV